MKNLRKMLGVSALSVMVSLSACKKDEKQIVAATTFTNYTIRQGQQFCDQSTFSRVEYTELKFVVKFDSTAIYTTINPSNQYDINYQPFCP